MDVVKIDSDVSSLDENAKVLRDDFESTPRGRCRKHESSSIVIIGKACHPHAI